MTKIARNNFELDDEKTNTDLAKKMIKPYYFTDRKMKVQFKITLESRQKNHAKSKLIIKTNCPDFGVEVRYINKINKKFLLFILD